MTAKTTTSGALAGRSTDNSQHAHHGTGLHERFSWFARETAHISGAPGTFLLAVTIIAVWAITGPIFGFSDTWQLIINTGTTIVTFLMVFLIQNTQNRDSLAVQIKLAELIIAMKGAENRLANAEEMSDDELEELHQQYRNCATSVLDHLNKRRATLNQSEHHHEAAQAEPHAAAHHQAEYRQAEPQHAARR